LGLLKLSILKDIKMFARKNYEKREKFVGGGKISSIEYQKTNAERVNIYLDDEYAFSVSDIVAAEYHLRAGLVINDTEVEEMQVSDQYNLQLAAAINFISLRPRSVAEVRTRLKRNYPDAVPAATNRVIERLTELKYLNDTEFVRFWIEGRNASAPRGRHLLRQELLQKGVAKALVEEALTQYLDVTPTPDPFQTEPLEAPADSRTVEEQQALELARRKASSYAGEDWAGFYRKLGGFMLRRGYDYGITGRVVKAVWRELKDEAPGEDFEEELT
jgi:regulatory protein